MRKLITLLLSLWPFSGAVAKTVTGSASFYHDRYEGRPMANGQLFSQRDAVVATYEFKLGTRVEITYVSERGQVRRAYGVVCDRGPAEHLRVTGRKFDLSRSLFKQLESPRRGVIKVSVREVKS